MENTNDRILKISQSDETGEVKSISYKGERVPRPVKKIPLSSLLYNPHNGRIRSLTKSYESQHGLLDNTKQEDKLIIEQYLYDSAPGKNEKTLESLEAKGQQEVGIVTKDGVIIDGNRRAMLLNILSKRNNEPGFFEAIVLEDNLVDNAKEIVTLETGYQMGVDSKVDYNPIEKYIRCSELLNIYSYSELDIAHIMAENESTIREWLERLKVMDDYLVFWKSPEIYTRLDKREGHFVDLQNYLKSYSTRRPPSINWVYTSDDIDNLKHAYFGYIRLGIPVLRARVIATPASGNSFFCHKEIWDEFYTEYNDKTKSVIEPIYTEIKDDLQSASNEDAIRILDTEWKIKMEEFMMENLSFYESTLKDRLEIFKPVKILRRIRNSINQIDETSLIKADTVECKHLLEVIINRSQELANIIS